MKYIIMVLSILSLQLAHAGDKVCSSKVSEEEVKEQLEIKTDVPSHLKGAVIIVRRADGKESIVPAEKFKVVPRKQQFIVTKVQQNTNNECVVDTSSPNRVSALIGRGVKNKLSVDRSNAPNQVDVSTDIGEVGGLQYQRKVTDTFSIGVQGQTNNTGSVMIGVDF